MTASTINSSKLSWYSSLYSSANGGKTGPIKAAASSGSSAFKLLSPSGGSSANVFQNILSQYNSYNTMDKGGIFTKYASLSRSSGNSTATVETEPVDITKTSAYQNAVAAYRAGAMNPHMSTLTSGLIASVSI